MVVHLSTRHSHVTLVSRYSIKLVSKTFRIR